MVTRKPLPENSTVDPTVAPHLDMEGTREEPGGATEKQKENVGSDVESWEGSDDSDDNESLQASHEEAEGKPTMIQGAETAANAEGPTTSKLRPAVTGESDSPVYQTPDSTGSRAGPLAPETNPFRRKMSMSQSSGQNSVTVPPMPSETPPLPPSETLSKLSLNEASNNPWQPVLNEQKLGPATLAVAADQEPAQNIWASQVPSRAASTGPNSNSPALQSLTSEEKGEWGDDLPERSSIAVPTSFRTSLEDQELREDSHAWDHVSTQDKGKAPMKQPPTPNAIAEGARDDELNLIDNDPTPGPSAEASQSTSHDLGAPPSLPHRNDEKAPLPPPTTPASGKTEVYQVKKINWHDANTGQNLRSSPILVQNANGPCPLMALVNALTLTTPGGAEDAVLLNTLKTREQISLDLLLNAVLDELTSERMPPDQSLPDIGELYAFLQGLHTGMNVNPRFIPTEEIVKAFKRTSLTHLHPTERGDLIPGTFEETKEMLFYRIFQIPLIHGWLPTKSEPVYGALERHAESYEDAQNILFREEELEDKLMGTSSEGLSEEEQDIYQDILSIKSFLHSSATQLTPWGLEVITKAMRPGSVAILFRNDHFSTLYRHPQTLQIFALVTDAGYAGHDEIVWESLVDVNGERSEFFSGDFLLVGGPSQDDDLVASGSASASNGKGEWQTVQTKRGKTKTQTDGPPMSPKEQEDRDLALALQLQEEEDQRHRSEQAQRRREAQLSEQYIEQQAVRRGPVGLRQASNGGQTQTPTGRRTSSASRGGAAISGRGGGPRPQQQQVRPLVPPVLRSQGVSRPVEDGVDEAPPSYEDAARESPYMPPAGHPSHPNSSPSPSVNISAPSSSMPRLPGSRAPGVAGPPAVQPPAVFRRGGGYRQGVPPTATAGSSGSGRDKDCIIM